MEKKEKKGKLNIVQVDVDQVGDAPGKIDERLADGTMAD